MPSFSQNMGLVPLEKTFQLEDLDSRTRNKLWNILHRQLWSLWKNPTRFEPSEASENRGCMLGLVGFMWHEHYGRSLDDMPDFRVSSQSVTYNEFRKSVIEGPWNEAFDLLQFITSNANAFFHSERKLPEKLCEGFNAVLAQENAGYRFVNKIVVPITDQSELKSITDAVSNPLENVKRHLTAALSLFSDRTNPDYRNSAKESISAVEAICQSIAGNKNASLADCLKIIKQKHAIHGAFEQALSRLYGYTSDGDGIRHCLSDAATELTADDAKFMLVTCSAFVNYLTAIAASTGIELKAANP